MPRRARVADVPRGPLGLDEVGLFVDYEDRQEAKDLGGYRWSAERKCWIFPASRRRECQRLANTLNERNGYTPTAEERLGAETTSGQRKYARSRSSSSSSSSSRSSGDLTGAIVSMFALLPVSCRKPALIAMRRALHPDTGGDTAAMQALNAATSSLRLE